MKKIVSILLAVAMVFTVTSCKTAEENQNEVIEQKPLVAVIIDEGGIGDCSFNDAVLEALEEAKEDYDIEIRCIESEDKNNYEEQIKEAVYEDAVIVIAAGSHMGDAVAKVAKENPDKYFGIVDSYKTADNILSMSFADNESGFLAGYAAGKTTKTNKVALIAGEERKTVDVYRYGFEAGLKMANPKADFNVAYTDTFLDSDKGYDTAMDLIEDNNVDVIFHVAGATGKGVIDACKEKGIWAIGADKDQSQLAKDTVLCSAVKDMEDGIFEMIDMAMGKVKFEGGHTMFGLHEDGVELSDEAMNLPKDIKEEIDQLSDKIQEGDMDIPDDKRTLELFISNGDF